MIRYQATRFKFTLLITITIILSFLSLLGCDIYTSITLARNIELSQFTIFLGGALVARWIDAWSLYFKAKEQEDANNQANELIGNITGGSK